MKYGWANPIDGSREQDDSEQSAKLRVWEELQNTTLEVVIVYEQREAGKVTVSNMECAWGTKCDWKPVEFGFCHPMSGQRLISAHWPGGLIQDALKAQNEAGTLVADDGVIVYWQRPAFRVFRDDPRPALAPPPVDVPKLPRSPLKDLESQLTAISVSPRDEPGLAIAKITALAMLDIAESLHLVLRGTVEENLKSLASETTAESLKRFDETWDWFTAKLCTCTGDGHAADGTFCVCEAGQELKRRAVVEGKKDPEPIPGCTACYMFPAVSPDRTGAATICRSCGRHFIVSPSEQVPLTRSFPIPQKSERAEN